MLIDNLLMQGFSENRKIQNRKWKIWSTSFNPLSGRREYLITYSKTNTSKFPKRESFSEALVVKFNSGKSVDKVQLWSRFKEQHGNGGIRYHCVLKVAENKKCKSLKENISKKHNITLHFSDKHYFYLSAYKYICKEDTEVAHSKNRSHLLDAKSPRAKKSFSQSRTARAIRRFSSLLDGQKTTKQTEKRVTYTNVADFLQ